MYFSNIVVASLAAVLAASPVSANAIVKNNCRSAIYVQSFPNGQSGANPGPLLTIAPGQTYNEGFRAAGSAIKINNQPNVNSVLTFGYTPNGNTVYYDLSDAAGNPFAGSRNTLVATNSACPRFDCAPNSGSSCYSDSQSIKVKACQNPGDLVTTVCA